MNKPGEIRVVTVRLCVDNVPQLRDIAATSAHYANEKLTEQYLQSKINWDRNRAIIGVYEKDTNTKKKQFINIEPLIPYRDYSNSLSAYVRDAITSEVKSVWDRFAKQVLSGHRSLPIFNSGRALCVRDRGVEVSRTDDDWFTVSVQLLPKGHDWFTFQIYKFTEKKKLYVTELLSGMADGNTKVAKATIVLDRRRKCVLIRLAYNKHIAEAQENDANPHCAKIGPVGESGELYLRVDGPAYSFEERRRLASMTALVQMMAGKKVNIAGIWQRVRLSKKRKAMAKLARFEDWALGPCHQLTSAIVKFCATREVKILEWWITENDSVKTNGPDGMVQQVTLPWSRIKGQLKYKGREVGIELVEAPKTEADMAVEDGRKVLAQHRRAIREVRKFAQVVAKT